MARTVAKGMEVQSPLPPLHSYRIPFQMATKVPINAVSLTTSAVSRVFFLFFYQNSDTLLRRRMKCVFFCRFCSSVSP
jgi:hypothetical protein